MLHPIRRSPASRLGRSREETLTENLDIQPITLARLIDQLQEAGLVARRADPGDRRALRLYVTENAK